MLDKRDKGNQPWTCGSCGAGVQRGVQCPLCGASLCPACDGSRGVLYVHGEQERMGPCWSCDGLGVIPLDIAEAA